VPKKTSSIDKAKRKTVKDNDEAALTIAWGSEGEAPGSFAAGAFMAGLEDY
jgi:hypothetical protein